MQIAKAEPYLHTANDLGEGPIWHPVEACLYWVDIELGIIYRYDPSSNTTNQFHMPTSVGALAFRQTGGLILATGAGFATWQPGDAYPRILVNPIHNQPGVRFNDGKVDPQGRFWAGGLDRKGQTNLFRLNTDGSCHTILEDIAISNGLGWSPDQRYFYYTDSGDKAIYRFDYEPSSGTISNRQAFLQLPLDGSQGVPDGLTIDSEGYIWSARWDGGKVVRYDPEGSPVLEVHLPVSRVTCPTFGSRDMADLFITTASTGLTSKQREAQPLAGDVFIFRTAFEGMAPFFFKG